MAEETTATKDSQSSEGIRNEPPPEDLEKGVDNKDETSEKDPNLVCIIHA